MTLTDTATTTGRKLLGSLRKIAFPGRSAARNGAATEPVRDSAKLIHALAVEVNTATDEVYSQLVNLGLHPEEVRTSELVYFILALTEYALSKWSRASKESTRWSRVSKHDTIVNHVVSIVLGRYASDSTLTHHVSQFRERSQSYSSSLLLIDRTVSWKQGKPEFALALARDVIGYENYVAGTILWSTATKILAVMREIILQLEGRVQHAP